MKSRISIQSDISTDVAPRCKQTNIRLSLTWFVKVSGWWSFSFIPDCSETDPHSSTHTDIHTHSGSHRQTPSASHTLVLFWLRRRKGGSVPIYGERGGGTFRDAGQSAPRSAPTFFRVTHVRDSIDARAGGIVRAKYNPSPTAALTWGYKWMERAKNSLDSEVQTWWEWKSTGCARRGGVLSPERAGNTCKVRSYDLCFHTGVRKPPDSLQHWWTGDNKNIFKIGRHKTECSKKE